MATAEPVVSGRLMDRLVELGRALRRSGVPVDAARMALGLEAALVVGLEEKSDLSAALEAVWVSKAQDRSVFRALFEAHFAHPDMGTSLLAPSNAPANPGVRNPTRSVPSVKALAASQEKPPSQQVGDAFEFALSASALHRFKHADFNTLNDAEQLAMSQLVRSVRLSVPSFATRRLQPSSSGARIHWPGVMHQASQTGGELLRLPRLLRQNRPMPLVVLVDVSGSMQRYARLLLAFLHAATPRQARRDVFAFGTQLTDLTPAFAQPSTDAMLADASTAIQDFAGGTQLGRALTTLRLQHANRLVGGRSLVLLISDGLDTGSATELEQGLAWLRRHSHRLLWLNPLLRFEGYAPTAKGAAVLHKHVHGSLAVHNLNQLENLALSLARLVGAGR